MANNNDTQFQKAEIRVLRGKNKSDGKEPYLECGFNPPEYNVSRSVNYGELQATASGASSQQFIHREADTLTMELFFDTSETQTDVRPDFVDKLDYLAAIDPELHAPPLCQVVWGDGLSFTAVVRQLDKTFTRFLPSGVPVRARVSVTFTECKTSDYRRELKPESTDKTKAWTVTEGDTLWLIAAEEYGESSHWRTIADANEIDNPRAIEPGETLELPPL
ncbi:MAG: LysM peptidoglycan-binding domain-containing protein [Haloarculaceae archaeon]